MLYPAVMRVIFASASHLFLGLWESLCNELIARGPIPPVLLYGAMETVAAQCERRGQREVNDGVSWRALYLLMRRLNQPPGRPLIQPPLIPTNEPLAQLCCVRVLVESRSTTT